MANIHNKNYLLLRIGWEREPRWSLKYRASQPSTLPSWILDCIKLRHKIFRFIIPSQVSLYYFISGICFASVQPFTYVRLFSFSHFFHVLHFSIAKSYLIQVNSDKKRREVKWVFIPYFYNCSEGEVVAFAIRSSFYVCMLYKCYASFSSLT